MKKLTISLMALVLSSCLSEFTGLADKASKANGVQWTPVIAIPLVYSEMGMEDLISEKGDLVEHRIEDDGSITLVYESTLFSLYAKDAYVIPDRTYNENVTLTSGQINTLNTTGSLRLQFTRDFNLNFNGNEVDSLLLNAGNLGVNVSSSLRHDVTVNVGIIGSERKGVRVEDTLNANYSGSIPVVDNASHALDGATLDLTRGSQGHSQFSFDFDIEITKLNNSFNALETIAISLDFSAMEFGYMKGYLTSSNLTNGEDSLKVSLFESGKDGEFSLADPRVKLLFTNSFGMPIRTELTSFEGRSEFGSSLSLTGYPSPFAIQMAPFRGGKRQDSVLLNRSNSNIADYINNKPLYNVYSYSITTDPLDPSVRLWLLDTSVLQCDVKMELPLHGTAKDYSLEQFVEFSLGQEVDESVDELLMRLHTENGFPSDVRLQIYFQDSVTQTVYDSLFHSDRLVLVAAPVDGSGRTLSREEKTMDEVFDRQRIDLLQQSNQLKMVAYFNTYEDNGNRPDVKFYEDYTLLLQFGIQAKITLKEDF